MMLYEATRPRFSCEGFYPYHSGRSPAAHYKLEDEHRLRRHQWRLAVLAFLGAL